MKRITKEEYQAKNVKELLVIAKEKNVVGRHNMKKDELIEALLKIDAESMKSNHSKYVDSIKADDIVAFKNVNSFGKVKVISAKVLEIKLAGFIKSRYSKEPVEITCIILQDKIGKIYEVTPADIIWVKTSSRWPKEVFEMLKGEREYESQQERS